MSIAPDIGTGSQHWLAAAAALNLRSILRRVLNGQIFNHVAPCCEDYMLYNITCRHKEAALFHYIALGG